MRLRDSGAGKRGGADELRESSGDGAAIVARSRHFGRLDPLESGSAAQKGCPTFVAWFAGYCFCSFRWPFRRGSCLTLMCWDATPVHGRRFLGRLDFSSTRMRTFSSRAQVRRLLRIGRGVSRRARFSCWRVNRRWPNRWVSSVAKDCAHHKFAGRASPDAADHLGKGARVAGDGFARGRDGFRAGTVDGRADDGRRPARARARCCGLRRRRGNAGTSGSLISSRRSRIWARGAFSGITAVGVLRFVVSLARGFGLLRGALAQIGHRGAACGGVALLRTRCGARRISAKAHRGVPSRRDSGLRVARIAACEREVLGRSSRVAREDGAFCRTRNSIGAS